MSRGAKAGAIGVCALITFCAYWVWALLASPDSVVVIERQVRLPILGLSAPCGVFFIAAPLIAGAVSLIVGARARVTRPAPLLCLAAILLNAFRGLKLHDPVISYLSAGIALAGIVWTSWRWMAARPFREKRSRASVLFAAGGLGAAWVVGLILIFYFVPWSLRGDLPGSWNSYPFGPALRSVLYADLAGYKPPAGKRPLSLRGLHLEGANLRRAVLTRADLRNAELYRARLDLADLEGADLRGVHMVEAQFSFANLRGADLTGADTSGSYSMGADLRNAVLRGSSHHSQRFNNADARGADFGSAKLSKATFFGADLRGASFRDAGLGNATFTRADLTGADLSGSSLFNATFLQTHFAGADLADANLRGVLELAPASLAEVRSLRGARLDAPLLEEIMRLGPGLF